jgi:hypothetical protein
MSSSTARTSSPPHSEVIQTPSSPPRTHYRSADLNVNKKSGLPSSPTPATSYSRDPTPLHEITNFDLWREGALPGSRGQQPQWAYQGEQVINVSLLRLLIVSLIHISFSLSESLWLLFPILLLADDVARLSVSIYRARHRAVPNTLLCAVGRRSFSMQQHRPTNDPRQHPSVSASSFNVDVT